VLARGVSRQQQARDVGAGNRQQQADRRHQQHEHGPDAADDLLEERHEPQVPGVVFGIRGGELPRDHIHVRLRLFQRDARSQASDQAQRVKTPNPRLGLVERDRQVHVDRLRQSDEAVVREREPRRHDADHGPRPVVDDDRLTPQVAGVPEVLPPQALADDRDRRTDGFVLDREVAPQPRRDTECRDEPGADARRLKTHRRARAGDGHAPQAGGHRAEVLEDLLAGAVVDEVRRRHGGRLARSKRTEHPDEARRVGIRQRLQEHAVDDGEHAGRGADAERQCADHQRGKQRLGPDQPERITDIGHVSGWTGG
jgi:hypothetical protein